MIENKEIKLFIKKMQIVQDQMELPFFIFETMIYPDPKNYDLIGQIFKDLQNGTLEMILRKKEKIPK